MNPVDGLILASALVVAALCWSEGLVGALWGYTGLMLGAALGLVLAPLTLEPGRPVGLGGPRGAGHRRRVRGRRTDPGGASGAPAAPPDPVAPPPVARPSGRRGLRHRRDAGRELDAGPGDRRSNVDTVAGAANRSTTLRLLNSARLPLSSRLVDQFSDLGRGSDFPRYVDVFFAVDIQTVAPPRKGVVKDPGVLRAS